MLLYLGLALIPVLLVAGRLFPRLPAVARIKAIVGGLITANGTIVIAVIFMVLSGVPALGQEAEGDRAQEGQAAASQVALGAGLAVGLAAIGAGIGVGITGSAAIGGITQKPELLGRTLIYVGLAEGVAIYGLIVAFMLITGA